MSTDISSALTLIFAAIGYFLFVKFQLRKFVTIAQNNRAISPPGRLDWLVVSPRFGGLSGIRRALVASADDSGFYLRPRVFFRWVGEAAFIPWNRIRILHGKDFGIIPTVTFLVDGMSATGIVFTTGDWNRLKSRFPRLEILASCGALV